MTFVFFFAFILLICLPPLHSATDDDSSLSICPESFSCPNLAPFQFPFYNTSETRRGLIKVNCTLNGGEIPLEGRSYEIARNLGPGFGPGPSVLIYSRTFENLVKNNKCEALMHNFTSPNPHFFSISIVPFITLFKCANNVSHAQGMNAYFHKLNYNSYNKCKDYNFYYKNLIKNSTIPSDLPHTCQVIQLPVKVQTRDNEEHEETNIFSLLSPKFSISFLFTSCHECYKKWRLCQEINGNFQCVGTKKAAEKPGRRLRLMKILVIAGSIIILMLTSLIFIMWRRYKKNPFSYIISKAKSPTLQDRSLFFLGAAVYSYTELEDATQNFDPSHKLGDGGFGAVYYGKLKDGREVAVKRLYKNNYKRVQQFLNEVEILTRLRHPNLLVLYGFTSGQSRELLLVYEYISNGTVSDHLHGEQENPNLLTWPIRMKIAIETASALVYLHASEIIHRDVKTNNILLDHNFCVKVADFGLSRLVPYNVTHVSTAPQGTPGYVDPQYHQCYQLTDKSDVYSFGVVLIELISSKMAVDLSRSKDEINLANFALNRIQRCAVDELIDPFLIFDANGEMMNMITSVAELAFRCLQYHSEMRPTMNEVLDMLMNIQAGGRTDADDPLPSFETNDTVVLLKDFPPSPVSVTGEWQSDKRASTTVSSSQLGR